MTAESKADLTFEEAMKRLEETVRKLESGDLSLSESITKYQESMQLVQFCREQLDRAEFQLEQLVEQGPKMQERAKEAPKE